MWGIGFHIQATLTVEILILTNNGPLLESKDDDRESSCGEK